MVVSPNSDSDQIWIKKPLGGLIRGVPLKCDFVTIWEIPPQLLNYAVLIGADITSYGNGMPRVY